MRLGVAPAIRPVVLVPDATLSTHVARGLLPEAVPHADAVFNAARSALLVHALTADPALLFEATDDRLHQRQRAAAMPDSLGLVDRLREHGHAAVVSGAGPSVLVLGRRTRRRRRGPPRSRRRGGRRSRRGSMRPGREVLAAVRAWGIFSITRNTPVPTGVVQAVSCV